MAGSVGPYGAFLHDGSEYTGNYKDSISSSILNEWHKPRISALIEGGIDLLAFETIPCEKEAVVLLSILKEFPNMKAWLSFNCKVIIACTISIMRCKLHSNAYGWPSLARIFIDQ